jgi:predicted phosphodiesterase
MRIGLLSDVHGNLAALRAVAAALDAAGPLDHVVVAGDLLQGGPRPRETWDLLLERGWTLVRGNEDESLGAGRIAHGEYPPQFRAAATAQIAWTRKQLGAEILARLAALPFEARLPTPAGELLVVHSSPRGTSDRRGGPHNTAAEMMDGYGGTGANAIAFGHYHWSFVRPMPWGLLINVASVGLPIRGDTLAAYTVLTATGDGWVVEQRHVAYDLEEEKRAAAASGMPPWEADPTAGA